VGAGPGNGAALARRFAERGDRVALVARDEQRLRAIAREIPRTIAVRGDVTDERSLAAAFAEIGAALGPVDTLVYNAGNFVPGSIEETNVETLEGAFRVNCSGCLRAVQHVLPGMLERGCGTIVIVGATASRRGAAMALPFAAAKSGQRAMAESMARALGPRGIHVAYVVVDGVVDTEATRAFFADRPDSFFMKPDAVANAIADVARQERSAWTFELDLRPFEERW
jgi:NADP-dependent 3-hydroxy acid dehydrogenase YdfG